MRFTDVLRWSVYIAFLACAPGCDRISLLTKPQPVDAQCDQQCYIPCDQPLDLFDNSADTLLAVSKVNRAYLVRCGARQHACIACLQNLRTARVIN